MPRTAASGRTSASTRVRAQNFPASLAFNGGTTKIDLGTPSVLTSLTDFSVEGWIKPTGSNTSVFNVGFSFGSNLGVEFKAGSGRINLFQGSSSVGTSNGTLPINSWSHVGVTQQGSNVQIYINGLPFFGSPQTLAQKAQAAVHGFIGSEAGTSQFFSGNMTGINVYSSALTSSQMAQRYQGNLISTLPVASYLLTEGAGTTAYDTSGNANNGTITAGTYTADVPSKTRSLVGDNLVYNGNFEYAPPTNTTLTINARYIDGTSGGSSTNTLFGWATFNTSGSIQALFDAANSHRGAYGLKISTLGSGAQLQVSNMTGTASMPALGIPVLNNTSYTYSFWMKTQLNSGSALTGAQMFLREYSGALVGGNNNTSVGILTTTGWTQYFVTFTTANSTRYVLPKLSIVGNDGAGTLIMDAWFDDIVLVPTTNTTRNLVP